MPSRRPFRDRLPRLPRLPRHEPLPSLYDRYPRATTGLRRPRGLQVVPLDRIVGTARHPSQNSADFLPLPYLRGRNWQGRWQRIQRAMNDLSVLPAVDLIKVGDEYYVADGHNRVAAALAADGVGIDADVTELVLPGVRSEPTTRGPGQDVASMLLGADELRQAATGRQSRTAEHRPIVDELRREQLTGDDRPPAAMPAEDVDGAAAPAEPTTE
ncbi:MAG TPA: hypothetical protein VHK63_01065 [Candidatus Limnocylindria bacterium]|nr:hypothetical protein [Candidatus Limnocylindria bacterium]